jgi:hypothetical protein
MSSTIEKVSSRRLRLVAASSVLSVMLASSLAGVVSSGASTKAGGKVSARLSKTSFPAVQAKTVKLVCKFSPASSRFGYLLSLKKGAKWVKVRSVKKTGSFNGSYSMTVKQLFGSKAVKIGQYRVKVSADANSVTRSFKVVKATSGGSTPTGSKPANTALPTISGTTTQGQTLSSSTGSWSNSPTSYAYQWSRCDSSGASCSDISGASSSSYTLASADVSSTIRAAVTATNAYGSASATSSQTIAVAGLLPVNTALPTISHSGNSPGQMLWAENGSWDNSPTSYTYQWQDCYASTDCSDIGFEGTSRGYTLGYGDVAQTVHVVVTATNAYGSASATSAGVWVVR